MIQHKYTLFFSYNTIKQRNDAIKFIAKYFDATIHFSIGTWKGNIEQSITVEILHGCKISKIESLCRFIKAICEQDYILLTIEDIKSELI